MSKKELRDYQIEGIRRFLATPKPHRYFFSWSMSAGKTFGSLMAMRSVLSKDLLIICPAIVRDVWAREVEEVFEQTPGVIRYGRKRKLSEKLSLERDEAYDAEIQVVSYELLGDCKVGPWKGIIVDECHSLRTQESKQSIRIRAILRSQLDAVAIGLSGTFIPSEARQVWNPIDTFIPNALGRYGSFLRTYCKREENVYAASGFTFFGLREDKREQLKKKLSQYMHRVTQADFAAYLPPLNVEPLHCNDYRLDRVKFAVDWYLSVYEEQPHVGIYTHHRKLAEQISIALCDRGFYGKLITGETPTGIRDKMLQVIRAQEESLIVGTTHALGQGVSLSFQKCALVIEWTTAPSQVLQFIGRFARQDSGNQVPTRLQFLVGPNDVGRSETLMQRVADINSVIKAGRSEETLETTFQQKEMEDDEFETAMAQLVGGVEARGSLWAAHEDTESECDD